jgi:uncharacterized membrane protein
MQILPRAEGKVGALPVNIAGAIAYLTFIPAIVFLARSPYNKNRFVRFHSVQCLLLCLTAISIAALLRLAALLLVLIPTVGPLLLTLISVVSALAFIVIWAVLVIKALQGETFELPLLGDLADRYADPL